MLTWRPPFVSGEALRNWAAWATKDSVQRRLAGERTGQTAVRLARDVEDGAVHAMLPEAPPADLERVVPCPAEGQGVFGVTAPEVLAIAANLRQTRSRAEQRKISELAAENAKKLAALAPGNGGAPPLPCPLQGENHICCTYAARPLHCLPLHARSVANWSEHPGRQRGEPTRRHGRRKPI